MNDHLLNVIDDDLLLGESDGMQDSPNVQVVALPGSNVSVQDLSEPERESDWENDGDHSKFMEYLLDKMQKIPPHRGTTTVGIERAIAYLKKIDREISRAIQSDEANVIDETEAEAIRDQIFEFVDRLEEALEKVSSKKTRRKKPQVKLSSSVFTRIGPEGDPLYYIRAETDGEESLLQVDLQEPSDQQVRAYMEWEAGNIKKEASSAKILLMTDPFLHEVTNILIRSHVTYGRNIESVYRDLNKKYGFTPRDHLAIHSLLREKGLLLDRDFARIDEEIEIGNQSVGLKSYPA